MTLRDKVTMEMLKMHPIPVTLQNPKYTVYYSNYKDNLYCPMDEKAQRAYEKGEGSETKPRIITKNGVTYTEPAKMASIASSSAMTFNLLGNGNADILPNGVFPAGSYSIEYEKQMYTLASMKKPAHLDAFLSNEPHKTAIFCEMKLFEWLDNPRKISRTYFNNKYYFETDKLATDFSKNAFAFFTEWAKVLEETNFKRYDAWQMFKHLLAIYNYTSFVTKDALNKADCNRSMAGKYRDIILVNVVNEFPAELIEDAKVRVQYEKALCEERTEAQIFRSTMKECDIASVFNKNCNAEIRVEYISAKDFAGLLNISENKKEYLKRYYS